MDAASQASHWLIAWHVSLELGSEFVPPLLIGRAFSYGGGDWVTRADSMAKFRGGLVHLEKPLPSYLVGTQAIYISWRFWA
jgi:hypothetical protein